MKASAWRQRDQWQRSNVLAAKIIVEKPDVFGPLMVEWARLVLAKEDQEKQVQNESQETFCTWEGK